jgi:hypothetical protein
MKTLEFLTRVAQLVVGRMIEFNDSTVRFDDQDAVGGLTEEGMIKLFRFAKLVFSFSLFVFRHFFFGIVVLHENGPLTR